jgi:hypothetical protein
LIWLLNVRKAQSRTPDYLLHQALTKVFMPLPSCALIFPLCSEAPRLHGQKGRIAFLHSSAALRVKCKDALSDLAYVLPGAKNMPSFLGGKISFDLSFNLSFDLEAFPKN